MAPRVGRENGHGRRHSQNPTVARRRLAQAEEKDDIGMAAFAHDAPFALKVLVHLACVNSLYIAQHVQGGREEMRRGKGSGEWRRSRHVHRTRWKEESP